MSRHLAPQADTLQIPTRLDPTNSQSTEICGIASSTSKAGTVMAFASLSGILCIHLPISYANICVFTMLPRTMPALCLPQSARRLAHKSISQSHAFNENRPFGSADVASKQSHASPQLDSLVTGLHSAFHHYLRVCHPLQSTPVISWLVWR